MLLRSITKHVKDQNWFAVFLDFFIVVAGILIAFQITNWNEGRQEVREEQALIVRLTDEFTALEATLLERIERAERIVDHTTELIADVRSGSTPTDKAAIKQKLQSALRYNAAVPPPTAFSEAMQSGRIGEIKRIELRRVLNEYEVSRGWFEGMVGPAAPQIDANSKIFQAVKTSAKSTRAESIRQTILDYDWPGVVSAGTELSLIHKWQSFQAEAYRLELEAVRNVLIELEI